MEKITINNWKLAHIKHSDFIKSDCYPLKKEEIEKSGFEIREDFNEAGRRSSWPNSVEI